MNLANKHSGRQFSVASRYNAEGNIIKEAAQCCWDCHSLPPLPVTAPDGAFTQESKSANHMMKALSHLKLE